MYVYGECLSNSVVTRKILIVVSVVDFFIWCVVETVRLGSIKGIHISSI